jgi:hypothetical protein
MTASAHPLLYAAPIALLASLIEAVVLGRRPPGSYDWKATAVSILDQLGHQILSFLPLAIAAPVFALAWDHRVATIPLNTVWSFVLLVSDPTWCC